MREICGSCGGAFVACPGAATHAYMASSPGCWEAYTAVLAREYQDPLLFGRCHRLTVDAYAVQHPGDPGERRARQSFWIHGASLWTVLRLGRAHAEATAALKRLAQGDFPAPPPPVGFAFTHADVLAAPEAEHEQHVRAWAEAALAGCAPAHAQFAALAGQAE
ncbi:DUF5946 family protein [Erythrobacter donghaensis]|uniref:DUF5946 family protein n=1 Tax=Erythrobacter donghaensis TaxID=267135 RepID=UPI002481DE1D|nr:DUF5946 family protein [Erythrobacter donghaensis]